MNDPGSKFARQPEEVTVLLQAWAGGDRHAEEELFPVIYPMLRKIAARHLQRERSEHTLQPTALVNEAYLRLAGQNAASWENRENFFAVASRTMRRVLVDHARSLNRDKRRPGPQPIRIGVERLQAPGREEDVLAVDEALTALAEVDGKLATIVELRVFGGMTVPEVAGVLSCSPRTVARNWRLAKAWLSRRLGGEEGHGR